jgi:YfiH family protein
VAAGEGVCGEGDALWTDLAGLALSVVTADCVPVVLADPVAGRVAAVHAGWRGVVAGVVAEAVRALDVPPEELAAWVGPAIGACCYEVGEDVAGEVASVAGEECVMVRPGRRPHLDLVAAVRSQLVDAGVPAPRVVLRCTRCDPETLWSYRREGRGAGRNHAFVWLRE